MQEKKPVSLFVVILNSLCALIYIISCIKEFSAGTADGTCVCLAIVWSIIAGLWIRRYINSKREEE